MLKCRYEKNQVELTPNQSPGLQAEPKEVHIPHVCGPPIFSCRPQRATLGPGNSANLEKSKSRRFTWSQIFLHGPQRSNNSDSLSESFSTRIYRPQTFDPKSELLNLV
jgi:hypothetical protein